MLWNNVIFARMRKCVFCVWCTVLYCSLWELYVHLDIMCKTRSDHLGTKPSTSQSRDAIVITAPRVTFHRQRLQGRWYQMYRWASLCGADSHGVDGTCGHARQTSRRDNETCLDQPTDENHVDSPGGEVAEWHHSQALLWSQLSSVGGH